MTTLHFSLTAPRRAVEPALLAQRLPKLDAVLQKCTMSSFELTKPPAQAETTVAVFAAQLGVQRNHITLEALPVLNAAQKLALQDLCTAGCAELGAGLVFTPLPPSESAPLGHLNAAFCLPPAAQFIGRDIATALPKTDDAKALRQLFNASQMSLHQTPLLGTPVNSVWFANEQPLDALGAAYVQGGLAAWWDALSACDAAWAPLLQTHLATKKPFSVRFSGADYVLTVACAARANWAFWQKPTPLAELLKSLAN